MWRWEQPEPLGYPRQFKAKVIAWYRLHQQVEMHSEEAAGRKAQQEANRKARAAR